MRFAKSALILIALAGPPTAPALADDCGPLFDAIAKTARTPHTATITRVEDGKAITSRMVQTKDRKYIEVNGEWRWMPIPADLEQQLKEMRETTKITCRKLGSEEVDGQPTTVYTTRVVDLDQVSENELWLGADGLPVKITSMAEGKTFTSILDYKHVRAPVNATPLQR